MYLPLRMATAIVLALTLGACASSPVPPATTPDPHGAMAPTVVPTAPTPVVGGRTAKKPPPAPTAKPPLPFPSARQRLSAAIDAYIAQPRFRHARWGIEVRNLDTHRVLYAHDADKLFIPASNTKLYTASLALHVLGPGYRFHTSLYATRHPGAHGVLRGDLVLYGRGDPGLGMGNDRRTPTAWADQLARALAARGVRKVTGNLIADDTYYAGQPFGAGWEANDLLSGFAPEVSALTVQDNSFTLSIGGDGSCCTVHVDPAAAGVHVVNTLHRSQPDVFDPLGLFRMPGSNTLYVFGSHPDTAAPRIFNLAAPDPARLAGELLVDALARQGIRFDGRVLVRHWPQAGVLSGLRHPIRITDVRSAPLGMLIRHMLKQSDNLYAQLLLMAVGKHQAGIGTCLEQKHPPTLTAGWGVCAMRAWLRGIGIGLGSVHFEEGSGLSRKDRVTPSATVRLLSWLSRQKFAPVVLRALPIAGVDGTLRYRMRDTAAAGNLRAKTGTLRYAYDLSGYVRAANGDRLAFSIMLNGYARPVDDDGESAAPPVTHDIDAVALDITNFGMVPLTPEPTFPEGSAVTGGGPRSAPKGRSPDAAPAKGSSGTRAGRPPG